MIDKDFYDWLELRKKSVDEFGESLCYCGHTDLCSCSDPDKTLFEYSVNNKTIILNDPRNGWKTIED